MWAEEGQCLRSRSPVLGAGCSAGFREGAGWGRWLSLQAPWQPHVPEGHRCHRGKPRRGGQPAWLLPPVLLSGPFLPPATPSRGLFSASPLRHSPWFHSPAVCPVPMQTEPSPSGHTAFTRLNRASS